MKTPFNLLTVTCLTIFLSSCGTEWAEKQRQSLRFDPMTAANGETIKPVNPFKGFKNIRPVNPFKGFSNLRPINPLKGMQKPNWKLGRAQTTRYAAATPSQQSQTTHPAQATQPSEIFKDWNPFKRLSKIKSMSTPKLKPFKGFNKWKPSQQQQAPIARPRISPAVQRVVLKPQRRTLPSIQRARTQPAVQSVVIPVTRKTRKTLDFADPSETHELITEETTTTIVGGRSNPGASKPTNSTIKVVPPKQ